MENGNFQIWPEQKHNTETRFNMLLTILCRIYTNTDNIIYICTVILTIMHTNGHINKKTNQSNSHCLTGNL